jgi:hypothetical protein
MEEERFLVLWFGEEIRTTIRDEGGKMDFCLSRLPSFQSVAKTSPYGEELGSIGPYLCSRVLRLYLHTWLIVARHYLYSSYYSAKSTFSFFDRGYSPFFIKRSELQVSYERTLIAHITNH